MGKKKLQEVVKRTFRISRKADERLAAIQNLTAGQSKGSIVNKLIIDGNINIAKENQQHMMHNEEFINQYNLSSLAIQKELQRINQITVHWNDDESKQKLYQLVDDTNDYIRKCGKELSDLVYSKNRY